MRSLAVVFFTPGSQSTPNIVQRSEPTRVQALVAQPSVEALDMAVLHRPARLDVDQPDLPVLGDRSSSLGWSSLQAVRSLNRYPE